MVHLQLFCPLLQRSLFFFIIESNSIAFNSYSCTYKYQPSCEENGLAMSQGYNYLGSSIDIFHLIAPCSTVIAIPNHLCYVQIGLNSAQRIPHPNRNDLKSRPAIRLYFLWKTTYWITVRFLENTINSFLDFLTFITFKKHSKKHKNSIKNIMK